MVMRRDPSPELSFDMLCSAMKHLFIFSLSGSQIQRVDPQSSPPI